MTIDIPDPEPDPDPAATRRIHHEELRIVRELGRFAFRHFTHQHHEGNLMPAVFVPGGPYLPPGSLPFRPMANDEEGTSSLSSIYTNATPALMVIAGIDVTAQNGSAAGPLFCSCAIGTAVFYWDSQSIGEGGGVTFSWRGAHMLFPDETLTVDLECPSGGVDKMSTLCWALAVPSPVGLV